jgi:hypothetical protein
MYSVAYQGFGRGDGGGLKNLSSNCMVCLKNNQINCAADTNVCHFMVRFFFYILFREEHLLFSKNNSAIHVGEQILMLS